MIPVPRKTVFLPAAFSEEIGGNRGRYYLEVVKRTMGSKPSSFKCFKWHHVIPSLQPSQSRHRVLSELSTFISIANSTSDTTTPPCRRLSARRPLRRGFLPAGLRLAALLGGGLPLALAARPGAVPDPRPAASLQPGPHAGVPAVPDASHGVPPRVTDVTPVALPTLPTLCVGGGPCGLMCLATPASGRAL